MSDKLSESELRETIITSSRACPFPSRDLLLARDQLRNIQRSLRRIGDNTSEMAARKSSD